MRFTCATSPRARARPCNDRPDLFGRRERGLPLPLPAGNATAARAARPGGRARGADCRSRGPPQLRARGRPAGLALWDLDNVPPHVFGLPGAAAALDVALLDRTAGLAAALGASEGFYAVGNEVTVARLGPQGVRALKRRGVPIWVTEVKTLKQRADRALARRAEAFFREAGGRSSLLIVSGDSDFARLAHQAATCGVWSCIAMPGRRASDVDAAGGDQQGAQAFHVRSVAAAESCDAVAVLERDGSGGTILCRNPAMHAARWEGALPDLEAAGWNYRLLAGDGGGGATCTCTFLPGG